jgi:hypothetical protein
MIEFKDEVDPEFMPYSQLYAENALKILLEERFKEPELRKFAGQGIWIMDMSSCGLMIANSRGSFDA